MFFSFLAVFPLPESYQNDPKFHFNTLLRSDTQKSSKKVENTTRGWSRCEIVFGPPPPAKADIATAILTNVIEHLVLLLPPNKHAFTAKAVWADFIGNIPNIFRHTHLMILMVSFWVWGASRWIANMEEILNWLQGLGWTSASKDVENHGKPAFLMWWSQEKLISTFHKPPIFWLVSMTHFRNTNNLDGLIPVQILLFFFG